MKRQKKTGTRRSWGIVLCGFCGISTSVGLGYNNFYFFLSVFLSFCSVPVVGEQFYSHSQLHPLSSQLYWDKHMNFAWKVLQDPNHRYREDRNIMRVWAAESGR